MKNRMKYYIIFKPVFYKKDKTLAGYDVAARVHYLPHKWEGYDVISIEKEEWSAELVRLQTMLLGNYDIGSGVSFVDKHPLEVLRYLRGEEEPKKPRTAAWQNEIDRWSVDLRGERV